jgi:hypothetical protein
MLRQVLAAFKKKEAAPEQKKYNFLTIRCKLSSNKLAKSKLFRS